MEPPSKRMSPAVGAMSFMIIRPVVVLPQPDSPTSPTVSPRPMSKVIPSTARTARAGPRPKRPPRTGKCFTRFLTSRSAGCTLILVLREQAADRATVAGIGQQRHVVRLALGPRLVAPWRERTPGRQVRGIGG